jgi:hypothetical protein
MNLVRKPMQFCCKNMNILHAPMTFYTAKIVIPPEYLKGASLPLLDYW